MAQPPLPKFGNVLNPNLAWVAKVKEAALEPDLPIVDPHHHLWERPNNVYMLPDLLADTGEGHNIIGTVFVDCGSMFRADGPAEMKCVGEVEFVNGTAAMSASGHYGKTCGPATALSAMPTCASAPRCARYSKPRCAPAAGRFSGIRFSDLPRRRPGDPPGPHQPGARPDGRQDLARGLRAVGQARPHLRFLALPSADRRAGRPGRRLSGDRHRARPCRRAAGLCPLCRPPRRDLRRLEEVDGRARQAAQRQHQAGRARHAHGLLQFLRTADPARLRRRWPPPSSPGSRPASSCSAPSAACSKATSRSTR